MLGGNGFGECRVASTNLKWRSNFGIIWMLCIIALFDLNTYTNLRIHYGIPEAYLRLSYLRSFVQHINPIQDGHFLCCSRMGRVKKPHLPKICHTYLTMIKFGTVIPYLKKIEAIYESRDTPPEFCWHQHFSSEIKKFCYNKKYRYKLHFGT